ncbi:hypothetical protein M0811_12421 [Anaeramoeba ignava]|uniref:BTB domain-containing protein n=1 Tax=Anaeramoeba ignava TaxID=1746090 RepID=A0A9Q0R727_ANAIG|nr:hypothetical protein M0811_12421 [Anaeramoeba ignava]
MKNKNLKNNKYQNFSEEIEIDSNWIKEKGRKGIIKDLSKLYQENETKDFKIIIKEKEIKVHKLILITRSELFKGMFQLNVSDTSNQVHDYSKKSFKTIQQLIYFLYHDEFEVNQIPNEEYLDLKDYYQLNLNSIIDLILKEKEEHLEGFTEINIKKEFDKKEEIKKEEIKKEEIKKEFDKKEEIKKEEKTKQKRKKKEKIKCGIF